MRVLIAATGLAALALLAAACGGSDDDSRIGDFDDIVDGELQVVDVTGTSAAILVDTNIPVVCSVVYGTTTRYGLQATDLDMAGLPHSNHHPELRGLEPETVYHFRVQGTASDGTIYISQDMTFTTGPASAVAQPPGVRGTPVASAEAGASIVEASSSFGPGGSWGPENAIDGNPQTEWSSQGDGDDAFITVQLAESGNLTAVGIWTRTMGSSAQITSFQVIVDGDQVLGPFAIPDAGQLYTFPVQATGQELRFEVVESSGGNTGIVELVVFAE